jgi:F0F1-type ATP synthase assembly protein I
MNNDFPENDKPDANDLWPDEPWLFRSSPREDAAPEPVSAAEPPPVVPPFEPDRLDDEPVLEIPRPHETLDRTDNSNVVPPRQYAAPEVPFEPTPFDLPLNVPFEPPFVPVQYVAPPPEETVRQSGLAWSAGVVFFGSVAFMMFLGWGADLLLGSSPWGLVGGIVVGSIIGFIQFFRISSQIFSSKRRSAGTSFLSNDDDEDRSA